MKKLFLSATLVLISLAVVLGMQSCGTKPIDTKKLEGYWVLDQLDGVQAKDAFKGPMPTLEFNFADSLVAGSAGCNRYFGKFEITKENVFSAPNLVSTMMMCDFENKEDEFMKTMSSKPVIGFDKEGALIFSDKDSKVVLRFVLGEKPAETQAMEPITIDALMGSWTMTTLAGETAKKSGQDLFIEFAADSTVTGNAGCNNFRSKVDFGADNQLTFAPVVSTKMACPELDQETMFLTLLQNPVQVAIDGDALAFLQDGKTIAEFTKNNK